MKKVRKLPSSLRTFILLYLIILASRWLFANERWPDRICRRQDSKKYQHKECVGKAVEAGR